MGLKLCKECNKQFNSTPKNRKYYSEDCFTEHRKKYALKFQNSPSSKASRKEYLKSKKGKEVLKRYRQSEKGKATVKAAAKRFAKTPSGKERIKKNNKKWKNTEVTKERLNLWVLKNPDRKEEIDDLIFKEKKLLTNF